VLEQLGGPRVSPCHTEVVAVIHLKVSPLRLQNKADGDAKEQLPEAYSAESPPPKFFRLYEELLEQTLSARKRGQDSTTKAEDWAKLQAKIKRDAWVAMQKWLLLMWPDRQQLKVRVQEQGDKLNAQASATVASPLQEVAA